MKALCKLLKHFNTAPTDTKELHLRTNMANDRTVKGMKSSQGTVGVFWVYIILISCIFLEKLKDPLEMFGTLKSRWGRPCWFRLLAIFGFSVVVVVFGDQSNLRKEKVTWLTLAYHSPPGSEAMAGPQGRSLKQKAKREAADWLGLRDFLGMIFFIWTIDSVVPGPTVDPALQSLIKKMLYRPGWIVTAFQLRLHPPRWL